MQNHEHRPQLLRRAFLLASLAGVAGCAAHRARASGAETPVHGFAREGLYVGFQVGAFENYGDFDGKTSLADDPMTPTTFVRIPKLDTGGSYAITVAYRWKRYEIELLYGRSQHDGTFLGTPDFDTDFTYLDLLFKQYWWIDQALQPYALAGFGVSEATIENGATDLTIIEDAMLEDGINLDFGAGLALYLGPWASVYGQALYRFSSLGSANGIGPKLPISGDLDNDSLELSVGANFRLLAGHR
jgi:hypothetical protein